MTDTNPHEFYATPPELVDRIVKRARLPLGGMILDPGVGEGSLCGRLIESHGVQPFRVQGVEIDHGRAVTCRDRLGVEVIEGDFLRMAVPDTGYALILENPPFGLSLEFVEHSLQMAAPVHGTTCALLRLNFLASAERRGFLRAHPPDVYVLSQRPSFAVSVRCNPPKDIGKVSCGWKVSLAPDTDAPKLCPTCGEKTSKSTSDSSDYAFMCWGPGRGGHWYLLEQS